MTKKDFELIANTIKNLSFQGEKMADHFRGIVAGNFAMALATQNPRFDAKKFLEACK